MGGDQEFALGTFVGRDGVRFAAIVRGEFAFPFSAFSRLGFDLPADIFATLQDWDGNFPRLCEAADAIARHNVDGVSLKKLRPLSPVDLPRQVFGIGSNYRKFAIRFIYEEMESQGHDRSAPGFEAEAVRRMEERAIANDPKWFNKLVSTVIGADDPLPLSTDLVHWECEVAAIIGRPGYRIAASDAHRHIAGYAVVNDITDRTGVTQVAGVVTMDLLAAKSQPGFTPLGPLLVPAAFVDPYSLHIKLSVNEQVLQDDPVDDMLIRIDRQIELLSRRFQLLAGDVICTGTPVGNGAYHNIYLKPGDIMIASIPGLGEQHTLCVAA
jgi:2,4-diketo-3-deoxy-L-fuconate hydrolase